MLRQKLASGEGDEKELLRTNSARSLFANSWSPDGRFLLYIVGLNGVEYGELGSLVLPADDSKPVAFVRTGFNEEQGRFSPNGRWVAYVSNQSGLSEVYVREFTTDFSSGSASCRRQRVGVPRRRHGTTLAWGWPRALLPRTERQNDGRRGDRRRRSFHAGTPTPLFQAPPGAVVGDVTADGKRFLLVTPVGPSASVPFTVVLNWTATLKK